MPSSRISDVTLRLNATRPKIMNKGGVADQVYVANFFYEMLKKKGAIKVGDFGLEAKFDLLYQGNDTAKWSSRYEKYNTEPGTEFKPAIWDLKKITVSAVGDMDTIDENDSDQKIWDFVKEKESDALAAGVAFLEDGLHNTGTNAKAFLGLRATIADDPTSNPSAFNVGGIDRSVSANSFWRNQYNTSADIGATYTMSTEGKASFRAMYSTCMKNAPKAIAGNKKEPTIIYLDWDLYDAYEAMHDSNDLHIRSDETAKSGFRFLKYRNATLIPGTHANISGRAYFLNLNADSKGNPLFGLYVSSKANWKLGKWMEETDQDVFIQKIKHRSFLGGPYMKCHGVLYGGS